MAEWFKAAVLKTARGFTLPRGFESHPFRQKTVRHGSPGLEFAASNGLFMGLSGWTRPPSSSTIRADIVGKDVGTQWAGH